MSKIRISGASTETAMGQFIATASNEHEVRKTKRSRESFKEN